MHTWAGGVRVAVTVVLGARLKQLHPDESLDAAKTDRAGILIRFSNGLLTGRR